MIVRIIRWPLGQLILLIDRLTAPRSPQRSLAEQASFDAATRGLALYQFEACPFCVKTRRAVRRMGLTLETRDALKNPRWRRQLLEQGGRLQVPCLYIPVDANHGQWLYESNDIIRYLEDCCAQVEARQVA